MHKKGDHAANGSVNNLAGASFQVYSNATYTTAVPGATCTTDGTGTCVVGGLSTNTTYYVRETTSAPNFQRIDTLTTSSGGSQIYGQGVTTGASGSNTNTRDFANRRINPAFPSECGINIGLVMDLSNSISDTELGEMKTSAKAFVTALQGTPSKVGGYTFATNAPASGNGNLALTDVSSVGGADAAHDWINLRTKPGGGDGGTNWDAGLRQVVGRRGTTTSWSSSPTATRPSTATPRAVVAGRHHVPRGRGRCLLLERGQGRQPQPQDGGCRHRQRSATNNLQAVSGPTLNDDDFLAANFQDLQNKLQQIASQLCGGTVTVKKQVEGRGGLSPAGACWRASRSPGATERTGVRPWARAG